MDDVINYNNLSFTKYIEHRKIISKIKDLSNKINKMYQNEGLHIIGLLDGCLPTLNELIKHILIDFDVHMLKVSSYKGMKRGKINFIKDARLDFDIKYKNILLVDDIIDSGKTIKEMKKYISQKYLDVNLKVLSLLVKTTSKNLCEWYCFEIPNKYVIGYGMDINNLFRELDDIYILKE